eukprot:scaffold569_cov408-Prasinococcus_capsulatus_cf.AAC.49
MALAATEQQQYRRTYDAEYHPSRHMPSTSCPGRASTSVGGCAGRMLSATKIFFNFSLDSSDTWKSRYSTSYFEAPCMLLKIFARNHLVHACITGMTSRDLDKALVERVPQQIVFISLLHLNQRSKRIALSTDCASKGAVVFLHELSGGQEFMQLILRL